MKTLLEQAKEITSIKKAPNNGEYTDEHYELLMAWARGEVVLKQICAILTGREKSSSNDYNKLAMIFREGVRTGKIIYNK